MTQNRLALLLEILGYALAVAGALLIDPRILTLEAAVALIALGIALGRQKGAK